MTGNAVVVRPVRFTDRVEEMASFLQLIGLARRVETNAGGWIELVSGGGMVALHSAASSQIGATSGQTNLSFQTDDADSLVLALRAAGFADAHVYDEGYGRVLEVTDPLGDLLQIDEKGDPYGYRVVDGGPAAADLRVVPVRFTSDGASYATFLHALGLTGEPNDSYCTFAAADGTHGSVGVHHIYSDDLPVVRGPGATAHLTFTTSGDLDALQHEVESAGLAVVRSDEDFGSFIDVTDPDGQSVQIHTA